MNKTAYPTLSIITVAYNDANNLETTINSVLRLNYPHIEYIIVDGGSSDHTATIIEKYQSKISCFVSEKDQGTYDAMNKGIRLAHGEWINFLNAGDQILLLNPNDLISNTSTFSNYYYDEEKKSVQRRPITKRFLTRNMPCHQSIIYRKDEILEYSLKYRVTADFVQILNMLKSTIKKQGSLGSSLFYYNVPGISNAHTKQKGWDLAKQLLNRSSLVYNSLGGFYYLLSLAHACRILLFKSLRG